MFSFPVLELAISLGSLIPFRGEWYLEARYAFVCPIVIGIDYLPVSLGRQSLKNVYVHMYACIYVCVQPYLHLYFCMYLEKQIQTGSFNSNLPAQGLL